MRAMLVGTMLSAIAIVAASVVVLGALPGLRLTARSAVVCIGVALPVFFTGIVAFETLRATAHVHPAPAAKRAILSLVLFGCPLAAVAAGALVTRRLDPDVTRP